MMKEKSARLPRVSLSTCSIGFAALLGVVVLGEGVARSAPNEATAAPEPVKTVASPPTVPAPTAPSAPAKPPGPLTPKFNLSRWTLPNGLEVLFVPDRRAPIVTVQVWYHVGSKDEPRGMRGIARMFERLMFGGSKRVPPDQHTQLIAQVGGDSNAFTTEDVTSFFETVPRGYLEFAFELEADRMRNLVLREDTVNRARAIVKEEKRQLSEGDPLAQAFERFREIAFTRHPYAWTPSGDLAELDQVSLDAVRRFYDVYYRPNNATLIVVGDATEENVRALVTKHFASLAKGGEIPRPASVTPEPAQTARRSETVTWPAQIGMVIAGFKVPAATSPDSFALEVLAALLAENESSLLPRALVGGKPRVALQAGGSQMTQEDPGLLVLYGTYPLGQEPEPLRNALLAQISKIAGGTVPTDLVERAKRRLVSSYLFGLQRIEGIATQLGSFHYLYRDPSRFLIAAQELDRVTQKDVARVAKQYLAATNMTLVTVKPSPPPPETEEGAAPAERGKNKLGTTPGAAPAPATAVPPTAPVGEAAKPTGDSATTKTPAKTAGGQP